jgi:hypothetical protein
MACVSKTKQILSNSNRWIMLFIAIIKFQVHELGKYHMQMTFQMNQ